MKPLSLYIHMPWCIKKCPYCDFNSHEWSHGLEKLPEKQYIDALLQDLERDLPLVWGRKIHSIFIGGGTPSLFSASSIKYLLEQIAQRISILPDAEITLEANPGTFEQQHFEGLAQAGINRLSLGIQSFQNHVLTALGRIHDGAQAQQALHVATQLFSRINIDLMYASPRQTASDWQRDVDIAINSGVEHLSLYQMTLEPNTFFHQFPPQLPDEEQVEQMMDIIDTQVLDDFHRYEVSAYHLKKYNGHAGKPSFHNMNYWHFGDYLGIGAGAHSKISFAHHQIRMMKFKQPKKYQEIATTLSSQNAQHSSNAPLDLMRLHDKNEKIVADELSCNPYFQAPSFLQEIKIIATADIPFEFMLNSLRLTQGFLKSDYLNATQLGWHTVSETIFAAQQKGLIQIEFDKNTADEIIKPTELGLRFLNELQEMFL